MTRSAGFVDSPQPIHPRGTIVRQLLVKSFAQKALPQIYLKFTGGIDAILQLTSRAML
jgi:hypothetical protein